MKAKTYKTFVTTPKDIEQQWWVVDADGKTLGRLASKIATILMGKHKPTYTPNLDTGDYVVVLNCEKIHVTGKRMDDKMYYHYSGYPGGLSEASLREVLDKRPERAIREAVKRMLPKGPLGHQMLGKLKIYVGSAHPHEAQKPQTIEL